MSTAQTEIIPNKINVFDYKDYRKYLSDYYNAQKELQPKKFSYRYFSRLAGFKSSNFLHRVIVGERNLTLESLRKVADAIGLQGRDYDYFEALVQHNQAENPQEKAKFFEKLKSFDEFIEARMISQDQTLYLAKWFYPVVREMIKWDNFKDDPKWIASRITPKISADEAAEAMEVLNRIGFIQKNKDGNWEQTDTFLKTEDENLGQEVTLYHKQSISLGFKSLELSAKDRDVTALLLSLSPAHFEVLRKMIHHFEDEVFEMINSPITEDQLKALGLSKNLLKKSENSDINEVCQMNCQLFKIAKRSKKS